MTDERLNQILKQALSPEIDDSEIIIQRKVGNKQMKKKKLISFGIAACAALTLVVTGINVCKYSKLGGEGSLNDGNRTVSNNIFAITAQAEELPDGVSSGDVIGLSMYHADTGDVTHLQGRFTISGENIKELKISTDKCNLYSVTPDKCFVEEGKVYEGAYNDKISFGMSVPEELWSTEEDLRTFYNETVKQVDGAVLTIEVTFVDGSTEMHHYKVVTGQIHVPTDENGYLQWDNLTRFINSEDDEDECYTYGYLIEKID